MENMSEQNYTDFRQRRINIKFLLRRCKDLRRHWLSVAVNNNDCHKCQKTMSDLDYLRFLKNGGVSKCIKHCIQPFLIFKHYQSAETALKDNVPVPPQLVQDGHTAIELFISDAVDLIGRAVGCRLVFAEGKRASCSSCGSDALSYIPAEKGVPKFCPWCGGKIRTNDEVEV